MKEQRELIDNDCDGFIDEGMVESVSDTGQVLESGEEEGGLVQVQLPLTYLQALTWNKLKYGLSESLSNHIRENDSLLRCTCFVVHEQ